MKLILILLLLFPACAGAQRLAATFQSAENTPYAMQKLDAAYPSALATDKSKAVFGDNLSQAAFYKAYTAMLTDLCKYLKKSDFVWGKPAKIFNRIYFEPNGSIDYYLVNLLGTGVSKDQEIKFIKLLNSFIQFYKINITANTKFAQCSPVLFQDIK